MNTIAKCEKTRLLKTRLSYITSRSILLKQEKTTKGGVHAKQHQTAWEEDYLLKVHAPGKYRVLRKYLNQNPVIYRQFDKDKFRDLCKEQ